jgi:hypothetical protein
MTVGPGAQAEERHRQPIDCDVITYCHPNYRELMRYLLRNGARILLSEFFIGGTVCVPRFS